jgi:hypothetical protein
MLLEVGNRLRPLLKLDILRLHVVLKVDDPVGMDIHLLTGDVKQHTGVVPSTLGLTTMEDSILVPQLLQLTQSSSGVVLISYQKHTLLHANLGSVLLKVEQVLRVLGQQRCLGTEVRVPTVRRVLKALPPDGVLLMPNQVKGVR